MRLDCHLITKLQADAYNPRQWTKRPPLYLNRNTRIYVLHDSGDVSICSECYVISTQRGSRVCILTSAYAADLTDSSWSNRIEEKGSRRKGGGRSSIYSRGCENASLIKSILGNRRCMNDGALVRGASGLASEKIRAYRGYNGAIRRGTFSVFHRDIRCCPGWEFTYGTNRAIISLAINRGNITSLPVVSIIGQCNGSKWKKKKPVCKWTYITIFC